MKVYLEPPQGLGRAIHKAADALADYAPFGITRAKTREEADRIVHHVVGVGNFDTVPLPERIAQDGKPYGVVQYCLKTTEQPDPRWWYTNVWKGARAVWSYYELPKALQAAQPDVTVPPPSFAFHHAPLAVEPVFWEQTRLFPAVIPKPYLIGTSGYVAESEAIDVWAEVAKERGGSVFHLGPDLPCFTEVPHTAEQGIDDVTLAHRWAACRFVNGLRAVEGFELPALEGIICGAIPVLFDRPEHHQWFGDNAIYVKETTDRSALKADLHRVCELSVKGVSETTRWAMAQRFGWKRWVQGFWQRMLVP